MNHFEAGTSNRNTSERKPFGLARHWLRKWREFCKPITERSSLPRSRFVSRHATAASETKSEIMQTLTADRKWPSTLN